MKKLFLILLIVHCSLLIAKAQWIKQFSPNNDLNDIEFIDRYTGWSCGENYIYKTTDGGISWTEQSHPSAFLIQQIFPVNEKVVYAVGWWNFLKTTNGGDNWTAIFAGGTGQGLPVLEGLYFLNENTGWLVGNVVAMKTTDGGNSFTDSMRIEEISQDVYFKDSLNGILCGYSGGFRKTTNGGKTWERIRVIQNGPLYSFIRLSVLNDSIVWLASKSVYKSTDFGLTWDSLGLIAMSNPNRSIYCMKFINPNLGYAGGQQLELFKTIDGGLNWHLQQTSQFHVGLYYGLFALNDSIIWASGKSIIINTINGGQVGINLLSTITPNKYKLHQNYPNPFNNNTKIKYEINKQEFVELAVYNLIGKKLKSYLNENQLPGTYEISLDMNQYSSGVYFYKLILNGISKDVKNMILVK